MSKPKEGQYGIVGRPESGYSICTWSLKPPILIQVRADAIIGVKETVYFRNFRWLVAALVFPPALALANLTQLPGAEACLTNSDASNDCTATVRGMASDRGLVVSPDGENVYALTTASDSGGLLIFDRDPNSGAIQQKSGTAGCIVDRENPDPACASAQLVGLNYGGGIGITVSPDGENVYIAGSDDGSISTFSRNTSSGELTQLSGSAGCLQDNLSNKKLPNDCDQTGRKLQSINMVAISPDGKNAYGATWSQSIVVLDRDPVTGALTQKAGAAGCLHPTGTDGCSNSPITQTQNLIVSPDGKHVYATSYTRGRVWVLHRDAATGTLTIGDCYKGAGNTTDNCANDAAPFRGVDGSGGRAVNHIYQSADGEYLYAMGNRNGIAILQRDATTGALSQAPGTDGCIADASVITAGSAFENCAPARGMTETFKDLVVGSTTAYLMSPNQGILVFNRNASTGALAQPADTSGCLTNTGFSGIADCAATATGLASTIGALSPDGATLYALGAFSDVAQTISILDTDGNISVEPDDVFPDDPVEDTDTDGDGIGDNGDAGGTGVGIKISNAPPACEFGGEVVASATSFADSAPGNAFHTQLDFSLNGCGSSVTVTALFGEDLPPGAIPYKVSSSGHWLRIPDAVVSGSAVTYTIEDNGPLDENPADGQITDPVTVVTRDPPTPGPPTPVPALHGAWLLMLIASSASAGFFALRRKSVSAMR